MIKHFISLLAQFPLVLQTATAALPEDVPPKLTASPDCRQVLTNHYIYIESNGQVDLDYESAKRIFQRSGRLTAVQTAYAERLPEGEKPKFVIQQTSTNRYAYVNEDAQKSEIEEVYRHITRSGEIFLLYYAKGERFFGTFQSVTSITLSRSTDNNITHHSRVYAYPVNAASRFFTRHLGRGKWYFKRKTTSITELVEKIGHHLDTLPLTTVNNVSKTIPQRLSRQNMLFGHLEA